MKVKSAKPRPTPLFFMSLVEAKDYAKSIRRMIYCLLSGCEGYLGYVFQIYPGGRTIRYPANARYMRRLKEWKP